MCWIERFALSVISLISLVSLTACGAGIDEVTRESYGEYGSDMIESFSCSGFGGNCAVEWFPSHIFDGEYILYRATLGSSDYIAIGRYYLYGGRSGSTEDNSFIDTGLEVSEEGRACIYKYRLDVFAGDESQSLGPILYRAGYPAAEPTNTFLGVGPSVSNGIVEIAIISDREQAITCTVNRLGSEERDIAFEREIGPGYYVFRWDTDLKPGDYEMRIPMVVWGEQEFENKCGFTVK